VSRGFEVLEWSHRHLPSPADPSKPLVFSDEQAQFIIDWYSTDAAGIYVYRRGAIELPKGWGKSPLGAVIALAESPARSHRLPRGYSSRLAAKTRPTRTRTA
jgi:hypothetical protein